MSIMAGRAMKEFQAKIGAEYVELLKKDRCAAQKIAKREGMVPGTVRRWGLKIDPRLGRGAAKATALAPYPDVKHLTETIAALQQRVDILLRKTESTLQSVTNTESKVEDMTGKLNTVLDWIKS